MATVLAVFVGTFDTPGAAWRARTAVSPRCGPTAAPVLIRTWFAPGVTPRIV
jgi:hypothetical protein